MHWLFTVSMGVCLRWNYTENLFMFRIKLKTLAMLRSESVSFLSSLRNYV